jgi:hypothetical protein
MKQKRGGGRFARRWGPLAALLFVSAHGLIAGQAAAQTGREVMEAVAARKTGKSLSALVEIVVTEGQQRPRTHFLRLFQKRSGKTVRTIVFVRAPKKLRNDGYLGFDHGEPGKADEQWYHSRRARETRRIEGERRREAFLESDFSYADLTRPDLDAYQIRLLREPELEGFKTWQIELLPKDGEAAEGPGYLKSVLWVRKDNHVVVRALHWLPEGGRLKHLRVTGLEEREGRWLVTERRMATVEGRRTVRETVFRLSEVQFEESFKRDLFRPKRLKRGLK